jgi:hypothetical protein
VDDRMRSDDFDANFNFFKTTKPWWSAFIHDANIDGFIPYAVNDPDYRNRVATSYFISYRGYLPELDTYQEKADVILADIAAALAE